MRLLILGQNRALPTTIRSEITYRPRIDQGYETEPHPEYRTPHPTLKYML